MLTPDNILIGLLCLAALGAVIALVFGEDAVADAWRSLFGPRHDG